MILYRIFLFLCRIKTGRENIFIEHIGSPTGVFANDVRMYANGLLNSQSGAIYFGVTKIGIAGGLIISRKQEDEYRLACDRVISNFAPFVSANHYRLTFSFNRK